MYSQLMMHCQKNIKLL